jgi:hypothetical protein
MTKFNEYKSANFWQHMREHAAAKRSDKIMTVVISCAFVVAYAIIGTI